MAAIATTFVAAIIATIMSAAALLIATALASTPVSPAASPATMSTTALALATLVLPVLLIVVSAVIRPAFLTRIALSLIIRGRGGRVGSAIAISFIHCRTASLLTRAGRRFSRP